MQDKYWFDETPEMQNKRGFAGQGLQKADWPISVYFTREHRGSTFVSQLRKSDKLKLIPLGQYDLFKLDFRIQKPELRRDLPRWLLGIVIWLWLQRLANVPKSGIASNALLELIRAGADAFRLAGVNMTMGKDLRVNSDSTVTFSPTHFYESTRDVLQLGEQNSMSSSCLTISQRVLLFDLLARFVDHKSCEVMV